VIFHFIDWKFLFPIHHKHDQSVPYPRLIPENSDISSNSTYLSAAIPSLSIQRFKESKSILADFRFPFPPSSSSGRCSRTTVDNWSLVFNCVCALWASSESEKTWRFLRCDDEKLSKREIGNKILEAWRALEEIFLWIFHAIIKKP
jgi:hypothetical protein